VTGGMQTQDLATADRSSVRYPGIIGGRGSSTFPTWYDLCGFLSGTFFKLNPRLGEEDTSFLAYLRTPGRSFCSLAFLFSANGHVRKGRTVVQAIHTAVPEG